MTAPPLNREELLRDSQATLREVAGILADLWDLQEWKLPADAGGLLGPTDESRVHHVLAETQREVRTLREGIGALRELFPAEIDEIRDCSSGESVDAPVLDARTRRAAEILREVQARLDRLAENFQEQGLDMA